MTLNSRILSYHPADGSIPVGVDLGIAKKAKILLNVNKYYIPFNQVYYAEDMEDNRKLFLVLCGDSYQEAVPRTLDRIYYTIKKTEPEIPKEFVFFMISHKTTFRTDEIFHDESDS